jgi:uncharacterized membrane-anchored protein YitT (DUF2179 family)
MSSVYYGNHTKPMNTLCYWLLINQVLPIVITGFKAYMDMLTASQNTSNLHTSHRQNLISHHELRLNCNNIKDGYEQAKALMMEVICTSETSVYFHETTRRYIRESTHFQGLSFIAWNTTLRQAPRPGEQLFWTLQKLNLGPVSS